MTSLASIFCQIFSLACSFPPFSRPQIAHYQLRGSLNFRTSVMQVVETRLFSEGLHVLGQPPSPDKLGQYLEAYFGEGLSPEAVDVVAHSNGDSLDAIKAKLQRIYSQVSALNQLLNCVLTIGSNYSLASVVQLTLLCIHTTKLLQQCMHRCSHAHMLKTENSIVW